MTSLTVSVKWQKEVFQDVEVDLSQPPVVFKGQLYALTGVPPERQKIMVKGGVLQDYGEWPKAGIKQGQRLMMMGTADAVPVAPTTAPVFVEDLPEEDQGDAIHRESKSAGLVNLGNTCYMNSTLQCLHAVPELKTALAGYSSGDGVQQDASHTLALAAKELFIELDNSLRPVTPMRFLQVLRQKFPQFAQRGEQGMFMQQDAEECWTQLVSTLFLRLRSKTNPAQSAVKELFGIGIKSTVKSAEGGEESQEEETAFSLKCHITASVNQLTEGLKAGLVDSLEKQSPALGRVAVFEKTSLISDLPLYVTVQFVRFFWKRESQQKAKILRKVGFPLVLDLYEFCTPELQAKLAKPRQRHKEEQDRLAHESKEKTAKEGAKAPEAAGTSEPKGGAEGTPAPSSDGPAAPASEGAPADAPGDAMDTDRAAADSAQDGPSQGEAQASSGSGSAAGGGEQTAMFDLVGVLTHKGRSADSGHYVAWVKQESGKWVEFDDEDTILRKEDDITKLSGGGDWHMAYILLYKARLA